MGRSRIDIHTHLIPPFWAEELPTRGGDPSGWGQPEWSVDKALAFMDKLEIQISLLSLTAPGIEGWTGADRVDIARRVNDFGAGIVSGRPERFGYLCTLPMPDVDATLQELRHCFDDLSVEGVCLHSNYDGRYLAEPDFDPVWQELESRSATVFIHPTTPPGVKVLQVQPSPIEDYPANTTKCAFDLVCGGHLDRFRSVQIVLSHSGGFLPYAADRFADLRASLDDARSSAELLTNMRRFYFDVALCAVSALPSLLAFSDPDHIVFGTDYPYASDAVSVAFTEKFDSYSGLSPGDHARINRGAAKLFPRFTTPG